MKVVFGGTRIVVLTRYHAIKIARLRMIHPALRLCKALWMRTVKEDLSKYDANTVRGGWKYVTMYVAIGVVANRVEYQLYRKYGDSVEWRLAPTVCSLFWGLVNIQKRGEVATQRDIVSHPLYEKVQGTAMEAEVLDARQFCVINGQVYCADYGFIPWDPRQDVLTCFG